MPLLPTNKILAQRVTTVRTIHYGTSKDAMELVATETGVQLRTWMNYEAGVTMPATVILAFIHATNANPAYLLHGDRYPMFRNTGVK